MKIKPVISADSPKYPVKEDVTAQQLKKQVPQRWLNNKAAKLALGALAVVTLAGCESPPTAGVPMPPETMIPSGSPVSADSEMIEYTTMGEVMAPTIMVAPLFAHGGGRGAFGCVMVAPPAFLTEDEALEVINDAAKEYGLKFSAKDSPELTDVLQPITDMYGNDKDFSQQTYMTMMPDFVDAAHGIAIEFISTEDVNEWQQVCEYAISAGTYDTKDAAQQLRDAFANAHDTNFSVNAAGVLYDPCELAAESEQQLYEMLDEESYEKFEQQTNEFEQQSREMSEAQLKKQALDFFKWLKSQEII